MKNFKMSALFLIVFLFLSACGSPTPAPTAAPAQVEVPAAAGKVTDYSIKIEQEQGSGDVCAAGATYYVTASITASGVAAAAYEVNSSSSNGQIPTGGSFQDLMNNGIFESVSGALTFDKAETKTVTWRLAGPYTYPNDITVKLRVNDGEFKSATVECPAAAQPVAPAAVAGCTDSAQYVSDDGKDGTVYPPNTPFTKMWKVKNTGTCTWDSAYVVSQVSGKAMSQQPAYMIMPQGNTVAPGGVVDISVGMTSPSEVGDYRADWSLQNSTGVSLAQFFLALKVQDQNSGGGSASGNVTSVVPQIVLEQGSGAACTDNSTYFVYVDITADGTVKADYRIDLTDGSGQVVNGVFDSGSPEETGTELFYSAETRRLSFRVAGPYSYPDSLTVRVYVNDESWENATVSCQ